jgi:hypothetical protein
VTALRLSAIALAALLFSACPRSGPSGDGTGPGTGAGTGTGGKPDAGVADLPERVPGKPLLPAEGIACKMPGCVYHAGAAGYFTCTSAGAGTCFHFGATCAPADGCMFDPADGRYKTCASPVEGTCSAYGAACTPSGGCMYNAADGMHHACEAVSDGKCTKWGGLCDP